jgi:chaperonin GroEL
VQVLRVAMLNAASVAKVFLTSDVIITEIPQPEMNAQAGAGMDAMGGY